MKKPKIYVALYLLLLICLGVLLVYAVTNRKVGSVSNMLEKSVSGISSEGIYDVVAVEEETVESDIRGAEANLLDSLKGVDINVINGVTVLEELYYNRDFSTLYKLVEHSYLEDRGVVLLENMFVEEQKKIVGDSEHDKFTLVFNKGAYISNYYLCDLSFVPVGEDGSLDYELSINMVFTLFFHKDGTFNYLPFNRSELFILSDYGVSRIAEGIGKDDIIVSE